MYGYQSRQDRYSEIKKDAEADDGKNKAAQELGRKGGKAQAKNLTDEQRSEIASFASEAKWKKSDREFALPHVCNLKDAVGRQQESAYRVEADDITETNLGQVSAKRRNRTYSFQDAKAGCSSV